MKRSLILLFSVFAAAVCAAGATGDFRRVSAHGLSIDVPATWVFAIGVCTGDVTYEHRGLLGRMKATIEVQNVDWSDADGNVTGSEWVTLQLEAARAVDRNATQESLSDLGPWHRTRIDYSYRLEQTRRPRRESRILHWSDVLKRGIMLTVATQESRWKSYADVFEHVLRSEALEQRANQPPEPTAMSVTPPAAQEPRQP